MLEVVGYNASQHVFLCKDDYKQRPSALKPKGQPGTATRVLSFNDETTPAAQQPQIAPQTSSQSNTKVTVQ